MGNTSLQKSDIKCDEHEKELGSREFLAFVTYLVRAVSYKDFVFVMSEKEEEIHICPIVP